MANKITQVIDVDTKGGIKNVGALTTELEGAESAGKKLAAQIHADADKIDADFKASVLAADALANALGPELAAKLGQSKIDGFVAEMKGVGLTADDIRVDVDELADAIKHMDSVASTVAAPGKTLDDIGTSADGAKSKLGEMRGESDNSRSVLANMVGNSAQDISALGGVAGTAGMALGQLGEYATEGNISLQGLAKVAGPMAAITVVSLGISSALGKIAKAKAFETHRVEAFTKALRDGASAAEAWDAALTEDKKVEFIDAATGDVADLTHTLAVNGISWEEFTAHLEEGTEGYGAWVASVHESLKSSDDANHLIQAGRQLMEEHTKALQQNTDQYVLSGQAASETARETERLNHTMAEAPPILDKTTAAAKKTTHEVDEFAESVADADIKYRGLIGALDEEDAWANVNQSMADFAAKTDISAQDVRDLTRDIGDYVAETDTIPESKKTEIFALLSEGDIEAAEAKLAELTRNREIYLALTGPGAVTAPGYSPDDQFAEGGIVGGPHGAPRPILAHGGEMVLNDEQQKAVLNGNVGNGGGSTTVNIYPQFMPTPKQLASILALYNRQNGRS
jgi:hypothetical protein